MMYKKLFFTCTQCTMPSVTSIQGTESMATCTQSTKPASLAFPAPNSAFFAVHQAQSHLHSVYCTMLNVITCT